MWKRILSTNRSTCFIKMNSIKKLKRVQIWMNCYHRMVHCGPGINIFCLTPPDTSTFNLAEIQASDQHLSSAWFPLSTCALCVLACDLPVGRKVWVTVPHACCSGCLIVDPMHSIFLGSCRHCLKAVWLESYIESVLTPWGLPTCFLFTLRG